MRRFFTPKSLIIIAFCALAACTSAETKIASHLANGDKYLSQKQYKEAFAEYSQVLDIDPKNKTALIKASGILSEAGQPVQALRYLQQAKEIDAADMDVRLKIAKVYADSRKITDSREELVSILEQDPENLEALNLLSDISGAKEDIDDAITRLGKVKAATKSQPRYNLALGKLYAKKGDINKAEALFLEALSGESNPWEAHLLLGELALYRKDSAGAEKEFKEAVEQSGGSSLVPEMKLSDFYIQGKNIEAAKQVLENTLQKFPDALPVQTRLAMLALERQDFTECAKYLDGIFKKDPNQLEAKVIRAQMFLAQNKVDEATVDLEDITKSRPDMPFPKYLLGLVCAKRGDLNRAGDLLRSAVEIAPNFREAATLLAEVNLRGGSYTVAAASLLKLLEKPSDKLAEYLLLSEAARTPDTIKAATNAFERAQLLFKDAPEFQLALSSLYIRQSKFVEASEILNSFLMKKPDSEQAHELYGDLLGSQKKTVQAEQEYRKAMALVDAPTLASLKLAELLLATNKDESRKILTDSINKWPSFLPAMLSLAKVEFQEGNQDEALKLTDEILQKNGAYAEARLLRGQIKLVQKRTAESIDDLTEAAKSSPNLLSAHYTLGMAYIQRGDVQSAKTSFREALRINPDSIDASMRLAEMDISTGNFQPAGDSLERIIKKDPSGKSAPGIHLLLGMAYMGQNNPNRASVSFKKHLEQYPDDVRGKFLLGQALYAQGKKAEAVKYFEDAMKSSPELIEPLARLVAIDLEEKNPDSALKRITGQIALYPDKAELYSLQGKVELVRGAANQAEAAFMKAIQLKPSFLEPYSELGQMYLASDRGDQALAKLQEAAKIDPKNMAILMLTGIYYQKKNDIPKAIEMYEAVLSINPRFAPAANNLAYCYAEFSRDFDRALKMAKVAKDGYPEDPSVSDTLGWVLYRQGNYESAVTYLQESASKMPDNAEIQFHLGMALYRLGRAAPAKQALNLALKEGLGPKWVDEVNRALAELQ